MQIDKFLHRHHNMVRFLMVLLVLLLASWFVSSVVNIQNQIKRGRYIGQDIESQHTITVSGNGKVVVKPDLAIMNFSVVNEAEDVQEAMDKNSEKMNAVIDYLKDQGIKQADLKTTNFNLSPRYEYYEAKYYQPTGERVLAGYEVRQDLQVKVRDLSLIGQLIKGASDYGANQVGDLRFTVDDEEKVKVEARSKAINQAREKAQKLAKQLGVSLVRIVDFNESGFGAYLDSVRSGMGYAEKTAPQIQTGTNEIEVNVNLVYEIK